MPIIEMARVDNRLIHGQISTRWCIKLDINTIVVVNDAVASNKIQQGLFDMSIPETFDTRYYSIEKAITKIPQLSQDKRLLIITESITDLQQLVTAGMAIPYINIGNLDMCSGKKHITADTAVSEAEVEWLKQMAAQGVRVEVRRIPLEDALYTFS